MSDDRKKVLCVFAHPDDEIIWGWPILQNEAFRKELIICSNDRFNRKKKGYSHRVLSLEALCRDLEIPLHCFDYDSGFARYPQRPKRSKNIFAQIRRIFRPDPPSLYRMAEALREEIASRSYDYLFTHNPWGEYGHMDHVVTHLIVAQLAGERGCALLQTDMRKQMNWLPGINAPVKRLGWHDRFLENCVCDRSFFEHCKRFYTDSGVWTWSEEPEDGVSVYRV